MVMGGRESLSYNKSCLRSILLDEKLTNHHRPHHFLPHYRPLLPIPIVEELYFVRRGLWQVPLPSHSNLPGQWMTMRRLLLIWIEWWCLRSPKMFEKRKTTAHK